MNDFEINERMYELGKSTFEHDVDERRQITQCGPRGDRVNDSTAEDLGSSFFSKELPPKKEMDFNQLKLF